MKFTPMKRIALIVVITSILFTSLSMPNTSSNLVSAKTPSCSITIQSLQVQFNWLVSLEQSYEQSMYFANEKLHQEYREEHLENAQEDLVLIVSTVERIGELLEQLGSCSGLGSYSYEDLEKIMLNIMLQLSGSFYSQDIGLNDLGFDRQYGRMVLNMKQLEENKDFKNLYQNIVLNNKTVRESAEGFIHNFLSGFEDRTLYRKPSYNEDDAFMSKFSVVTDGLLLAKQHIEDFINNLKTLSLDSKFSQNQKAKVAAAGANSVKSILKDNIKTMSQRALYKTAIEQRMIYPNMDPSQKEFSEDFAGNLASFMISTDYISFALSYMEMVGDLYDYINKQLGKVNDVAKSNIQEYERLKADAETKQKLFVKVNNFAQDVGRIKKDTSLTETQYVQKFETTFQKLIDDVKVVYNLNPNEIKIYLNGKLLNIPEKAYIENGTTMVPLRVISEEMNVKPVWDSKNKTITITTTKNAISQGKPMDVVFTIGSKQVQLGKYYTSVAVAPTIKNGVTFVPLSFVAQNLGLKSEWIAASKSVVLTSR